MKTLFTTRVLLALLVTVVFWASAFAGIRVGLQGYPPAHLAILRFVIASLVLGIYAALSHFRLPQRRDGPLNSLASRDLLGSSTELGQLLRFAEHLQRGLGLRIDHDQMPAGFGDSE